MFIQKIIDFISKSTFIFFNPFHSEWTWYRDQPWYWPESKPFKAYKHYKTGALIKTREAHNWTERVLNVGGMHDQGVMNRIYQYVDTYEPGKVLCDDEKAFMDAVSYAIMNEPQRWPSQKRQISTAQAIANSSDGLLGSIDDLSYALSNGISYQDRRVKEAQNVKMLNEFLHKQNGQG